MIKEDYVSFEVAKLLKEKGFNEVCEYCYVYFSDDDIRVLHLSPEKHAQLLRENNYPYITQQMAMRWLRDVHNIIIEIRHETGNHIHFFGLIFAKDSIYNSDITKTYEEAVEAALKYCLEHYI